MYNTKLTYYIYRYKFLFIYKSGVGRDRGWSWEM